MKGGQNNAHLFKVDVLQSGISVVFRLLQSGISVVF